MKNNCPGDKEIERTQEFVKLFDIKIWEELTQLPLKSDVFLLVVVSDKVVKVSVKDVGNNSLHCVSLPGYTYQRGLTYADIKL